MTPSPRQRIYWTSTSSTGLRRQARGRGRPKRAAGGRHGPVARMVVARCSTVSVFPTAFGPSVKPNRRQVRQQDVELVVNDPSQVVGRRRGHPALPATHAERYFSHASSTAFGPQSASTMRPAACGTVVLMPLLPAIPTTAQAVAASVACAKLVGLPTESPEVIAEGYSVRVRLAPAPVVTRVMTVGRITRGDPLPWLTREVAVATYLASAGAPVVGPWSDPGPHDIDGIEVSLWHHVETAPGTLAAERFGPLLAELHGHLEGYDADLPLLVGPLTDIASALTVSDDPVLHSAAARLLPLTATWPSRPLHGDAHTGNVLLTADGPRWIDFEDVCAGPVEWDLASTSLTDAAVDSYPGRIDRARLEQCRDLRRLQILAGILTDDLQDPSLYAELVQRLDHRR